MTRPFSRVLVARGALLALLVAGANASAQAPIAFTRLPQPSWIILIAANSVPGTYISQIQHLKLANNGPGTWTTALTVGGLKPQALDCSFLPANIGGDNSSAGLLIGRFDPGFGTFCVTNEAALLNSTAEEANINLSPDGLWAIFERPTGVWLSSRAAVGTQFGAPVQVTGFAAPGGNYYPTLGKVGGQTKCFYSDGTNIVMRDINLATATLSGTAQVVHQPVKAGAVPISPTPVVGSDGDVEALWLAELITPKTPGNPFSGDADPTWANDLDPATAGITQVERPDYQCCGGVAGGYVYFSHHILPAQHVMHSEAAVLLGDSEPVGGTVNLDTAGVNPNSQLLLSVYFLSVGVAPPINLFGIGGVMGLNPAFILQLGPSVTNSPDGTSSLVFPLPNNAALSGSRLALQAVIVNTATSVSTLTNTAWLKIQ